MEFLEPTTKKEAREELRQLDAFLQRAVIRGDEDQRQKIKAEIQRLQQKFNLK